MKTIYNTIFSITVLVLVLSCSTGPQEIDYGNDGCHFCKMTIVDKIHGAELVTDKGKVFKFDAAECMVNYINDEKELQLGNTYTNFYEAPTELITTQEATFLISKNLPSPMGANLTAFKNKANAEKLKAEKGGELFTWEELKTHLKP